jgi:hypothetical protein
MLDAMRTTLTLDEDIAAAVRRLMDAEGRSFKDVVNELIRLGLSERTVEPADRPAFRTKAVSLGRCLVPDLDNTAEVLALVEGDAFR